MIDRVAVDVRGVFSHPKNGSPLVFLANADETLVLPIVVGILEAQSILFAKYPSLLPRPMTHDFLTSVLRALSAHIREAEVTDLVDGTFFALLTLEDSAGTKHQIDARPSDAVALALRANCPMYIHRSLFTKADLENREAKSLLDYLRMEAEDQQKPNTHEDPSQ